MCHNWPSRGRILNTMLPTYSYHPFFQISRHLSSNWLFNVIFAYLKENNTVAYKWTSCKSPRSRAAHIGQPTMSHPYQIHNYVCTSKWHTKILLSPVAVKPACLLVIQAQSQAVTKIAILPKIECQLSQHHNRRYAVKSVHHRMTYCIPHHISIRNTQPTSGRKLHSNRTVPQIPPMGLWRVTLNLF